MSFELSSERDDDFKKTVKYILRESGLSDSSEQQRAGTEADMRDAAEQTKEYVWNKQSKETNSILGLSKKY